MKAATTDLPKPCLCPVCGAKLDASTALEGPIESPRPGDYSMCLHCGAILIYKADMMMRIASRKDLAKLDRENLKLLFIAQMARRGVIDLFPAKVESKH